MAQGLIDTARFKKVQDERRELVARDSEAARLIQRAKITLIGDQLKEARVGAYTLRCDEAVERGGGGEAPSPLQYFVAAAGF